jgi:hypothetical protein
MWDLEKDLEIIIIFIRFPALDPCYGLEFRRDHNSKCEERHSGYKPNVERQSIERALTREVRQV